MNSIRSLCAASADAKDGSLGQMNHDYGRRIEMNRSWTIYHVFTGVPAEVGARSMVGLSKVDATAGMLFLNSHNLERRRTSFLQNARSRGFSERCGATRPLDA
ncbi:hypothetical protein [Mesorhizobium helmanticense]|uniref:Uncharacterized protein n=1 Tax=Mesorhizobium helmanticense TaxID=1776423 RepID=A0A2T4IW34_9HYPH|nr:hypothetical protein [Mesorhizobium helmanticense]PTE09842.1 hypothetical protein C9427_14320 [Mesorhizobium helmanticense]